MHIQQLFTGFGQSWGRGVLLNPAVLQIVKPFLYGGRGHVVEFVNTDDVIYLAYAMQKFLK